MERSQLGCWLWHTIYRQPTNIRLLSDSQGVPLQISVCMNSKNVCNFIVQNSDNYWFCSTYMDNSITLVGWIFYLLLCHAVYLCYCPCHFRVTKNITPLRNPPWNAKYFAPISATRFNMWINTAKWIRRVAWSHHNANVAILTIGYVYRC